MEPARVIGVVTLTSSPVFGLSYANGVNKWSSPTHMPSPSTSTSMNSSNQARFLEPGTNNIHSQDAVMDSQYQLDLKKSPAYKSEMGHIEIYSMSSNMDDTVDATDNGHGGDTDVHVEVNENCDNGKVGWLRNEKCNESGNGNEISTFSDIISHQPVVMVKKLSMNEMSDFHQATMASIRRTRYESRSDIFASSESDESCPIENDFKHFECHMNYPVKFPLEDTNYAWDQSKGKLEAPKDSKIKREVGKAHKSNKRKHGSHIQEKKNIREKLHDNYIEGTTLSNKQLKKNVRQLKGQSHQCVKSTKTLCERKQSGLQFQLQRMRSESMHKIPLQLEYKKNVTKGNRFAKNAAKELKFKSVKQTKILSRPFRPHCKITSKVKLKQLKVTLKRLDISPHLLTQLEVKKHENESNFVDPMKNESLLNTDEYLYARNQKRKHNGYTCELKTDDINSLSEHTPHESMLNNNSLNFTFSNDIVLKEPMLKLEKIDSSINFKYGCTICEQNSQCVLEHNPVKTNDANSSHLNPLTKFKERNVSCLSTKTPQSTTIRKRKKQKVRRKLIPKVILKKVRCGYKSILIKSEYIKKEKEGIFNSEDIVHKSSETHLKSIISKSPQPVVLLEKIQCPNRIRLSDDWDRPNIGKKAKQQKWTDLFRVQHNMGNKEPTDIEELHHSPEPKSSVVTYSASEQIELPQSQKFVIVVHPLDIHHPNPDTFEQSSINDEKAVTENEKSEDVDNGEIITKSTGNCNEKKRREPLVLVRRIKAHHLKFC